MDKETRGRWLAELRSGNFEQSKALLKVSDKQMSALGILENVVLEVPYELDSKGTYRNQLGRSRLMDNRVSDSVGLDTISRAMVSSMNYKGKSFNEISDWIEENL